MGMVAGGTAIVMGLASTVDECFRWWQQAFMVFIIIGLLPAIDSVGSQRHWLVPRYTFALVSAAVGQPVLQLWPWMSGARGFA